MQGLPRGLRRQRDHHRHHDALHGGGGQGRQDRLHAGRAHLGRGVSGQDQGALRAALARRRLPRALPGGRK